MKQQLLKGKHQEEPCAKQRNETQTYSLSDELQERIAKRAYEFYLERGCRDGCDVEDWMDAKREILTLARS